MDENRSDFFLKALNLKDEKRTGWELRNIEQPESVADHTWGTALLCMVYAESEDVDTGKCVKMAVVHDLAEAETGDLVTRAIDGKQDVSKDDKEPLEEKAMEEMTSGLESSQIKDLWEEYEERETKEAKFVKDMDMIDMCLQALKYEKEDRYNPEEDNENFQEYDQLDEFFATTEPRVNTDIGRELFEEIKTRYEKAKSAEKEV